MAGQAQAQPGLRLQAVFGEAVKIHFIRAIYFIADKGIALVLKVYPYLVLSPRQGYAFEQTKGVALALKALQHLHAGSGGFAPLRPSPLADNTYGNTDGGAAFGDGGLYAEVVLRGVSLGNGEVFLIYLRGGEGARHMPAGLQVFGTQQKAAGFPVQAVGGVGRGGVAFGQLPHKGMVEIACRRVYRQPGRFVEDEQVLVLEDGLKGLGAGDGGLLGEGTAEFQAHAGFHRGGGFEGGAQLLADKGLHALAGEAAEFLAQITVQTPARIVAFYDEAEQTGVGVGPFFPPLPRLLG